MTRSGRSLCTWTMFLLSAAGVHHARLAQDGQQRGRPGDRALRALDRLGEHRLDVGLALGGHHRGRRGLADDGEDRALDRLRHSLVGGFAPAVEGVCEVEAVEAALALQAGRHAAEDLREDDARVPPGAHQGTEGDGLGYARHMSLLARERARLLDRGPQGGQHVRAGVAVGHGEDVEGVDLVLVQREVGDRGTKAVEEGAPVTGPPAHCLAVSTVSVVSAVVSTIAATGGSSAAGRRVEARPNRSTWMASSSTSRPTAWRTA